MRERACESGNICVVSFVVRGFCRSKMAFEMIGSVRTDGRNRLKCLCVCVCVYASRGKFWLCSG